ncbi:hypothetical protein [Thiosocius teredinicola]
MNMQLIRGSLVSALGMWLSSIAIFFALGTNNDLQEALAIGVAIVSPFVILGFLVAWAIPIHLLLKRRNHTRIVWYALIGIIPGPFFVALAKPFGNDSLKDLAYQSMVFSIIGVLGAAIFWFFAVKPNA